MRVLVTGAAGQLGREVTEVFNARPHHDVIACDRTQLDLSSRDSVLSAVTVVEPDVIVHCGAFTAVDRCETEVDAAFAVNAMGTRYLVDGAERVGAQVIYISTDYVFDGQLARPYMEWDRPNPQSVYGRSKLAGELELRPEDAIVRTSWVFGRYGANMVKTILRLLEGDGPLRFVSDQHGKPTCAGDLAEALYEVAVNRLTGRFHLTNEGATTWFEFARTVARAAGKDANRVEPVTTAELSPPRPAPRPMNSILDNAAWRLQGRAPIAHHEEAIERVLREF